MDASHDSTASRSRRVSIGAFRRQSRPSRTISTPSPAAKASSMRSTSPVGRSSSCRRRHSRGCRSTIRSCRPVSTACTKEPSRRRIHARPATLGRPRSSASSRRSPDASLHAKAIVASGGSRPIASRSSISSIATPRLDRSDSAATTCRRIETASTGCANGSTCIHAPPSRRKTHAGSSPRSRRISSMRSTGSSPAASSGCGPRDDASGLRSKSHADVASIAAASHQRIVARMFMRSAPVARPPCHRPGEPQRCRWLRVSPR